ncbi:disease resistance protein RGA3 [Pyrus ussuriensis x Pyrus communis]|uniref:Disease resistance protein RGA3 n=1 Tax=Pyrus ussuriensis x Pyrus communis TaxID=2448454 RepID=A0A5N5G102_9ROSA|nr:disease resistance protein RGA3 [Pyrus ussuriensis x Pyrus communis]
MADLIISLASPIVEIAMKKLANAATNEFVNIEDEIERLKRSFMEVQDLLKILEGNNQMNASTPHAPKNWLERLRAASYDIEDLIDCWTAECERWKMKKQQQQQRNYIKNT